jgi:hypothetical protein
MYCRDLSISIRILINISVNYANDFILQSFVLRIALVKAVNAQLLCKICSIELGVLLVQALPQNLQFLSQEIRGII